MKPRVAILISGRGSNMAALLDSAAGGPLRGVCEVVAVVSNNPDAPGLEIARTHGVPILVVDSTRAARREFDLRLLAALEPLRCDWLVLAGFMRILSRVVVERYRGRIVNIHPADTRVHRGLHGYRWAFERGLQETFVTVHLVDEGLDTGRILAQERVDLAGATTLEEVESRGLSVEHRLYRDVLARLFSGQMENRAAGWTRG